MARTNTQYRVFEDITIVSGASYPFRFTGNYIRILESTVINGLKVRFDDGDEQDLKLGIGLATEEKFVQAVIRNANPGPVTLTVGLAAGRIDDSRFSFSGVLPVNDTPDTLETPVAVSVTDALTDIVAASADTREVVLQNNGAKTAWFGDVNVDPATKRGLKLDPGDTVFLKTAADIKARCALGESTTISVLKNLKV
jgi:hypothetical protein